MSTFRDFDARHAVFPNNKPLCLVLSGGGLRAALFQLGIFVHLHETGRLRNVQQIVGVSGGGILAAHVVKHWERAISADPSAFLGVASDFVKFARQNIRNQAFVPWIWSRLVPWLWFSRSSSRTSRLKRIYSKHFGLTRMRNLPHIPWLALGSTHSSGLERVVFTSQKIYRFDIGTGDVRGSVEALYTPLSFAVTASSCFPPFFSPIRADHEELGINFELFREELELNDGGVTDNLGLAALVGLHHSGWDQFDTLVCDAERPLDGKSAVPDWTAREAEMRRRSLEMGGKALADKLTLLSLRTRVATATPIDAALEISLGKFRTDLDAPSPLEIRALMRHGAGVATLTLDRASLESGTFGKTIDAILYHSDPKSDPLPPPTEHDLRNSNRRPVVRPLAHVALALIALVLIFSTFCVLARVTVGPPFSSISRNEFEGRYPGFFRDSGLSRNLDYKAKLFRGMESSSPVSIKTVFFEGDPVEGKQGFVKIQLFEFPQSASGKIKLRAYSTESTGGIASQVVLRRDLSGQLRPERPSEIVEIDLRGGDEIFIVATYSGPVIGKYKLPDGEEIWRDWHNVEVSDLAHRGGVAYFFATGRVGGAIKFLDRYEVGTDFSHEEWYLSRPARSDQLASERIQEIIAKHLRDAAAEGARRFGAPHSQTFALLGNPEELRQRQIAWAAEEFDNAKHDIFYVTEPGP